MRFARHTDGSIAPLGAFTVPAQGSTNPAAYLTTSPGVATPWWQQWYVLLPVGALAVYMLFGMKRKGKPGDASATSSIVPALSGIFSKRKRKR